MNHLIDHGRTEGRGSCPVAEGPKPPSRNSENIDFVDITALKVLRDFRFSRNRPLKSADD
jgi:hypothetical protein